MAFDHNDLPLAFGPYTLLRRLAVGGMAEVYVAKTDGLGGFEKQVALKVIHPRFSEDEHFIQMLVEEAKISVLLTHVNIGQTLNLGVVDGIYYIAMEFIEGADAYRVMRRCAELKKAIPIDVAAFIAAETCNGLDFAHRKRDPETGLPLQIIHRDVSPQNILISFNGEVKIVDFGIAKAASRSTQTEVGVIKGKYYYMSPEQAWGDPMTLTSDVFSTGVVLYELLTGRMLYADADVPTLLDKVRKAEIPRPETRRPSIPRELSDIVMKALAKNSEDRFASAAEMGEALLAFLYSVSPTFTSARVADLVSLLFPDQSPRSSMVQLPEQDVAHDEEPTARGDARAMLAAHAPTREKLRLPDVTVQKPNVAVPQVLPSGDWAAPVATNSGAARRNVGVSRSGFDWSDEATAMTGSARADSDPDFDDSTAVDSSAVKSLRAPLPEVKPESFVMDDTTNQMPSARAKVNVQRALQHKPASVPPPGRSVPLPKARIPSQAPMLPRSMPPRAPAPRPMPRVPSPALPVAQQALLPQTPAPQAPMAQQQALIAQQQALMAQQQAFLVQQQAQQAAAHFAHQQAVPVDSHITGAVSAAPSRRVWWIAGALLLLTMFSATLVAGVMWMDRPVPSLQVTSIPPGAHVALAGAPVAGVTPVWVLEGIELGQSYPLVVTLDGYEPATVQVTPTEAVTRREVVLLPRMSRMRIETEPPGATVFARGAPRAAPITIEGLRMGEMLEVRVEAPGYLPLTQRFNVSAPDSVATLRLERAP